MEKRGRQKIYFLVTVETEGLFKNVQMQGAQKTEPQGYTLSNAVCSATPAFAEVNSADERFSTAPQKINVS